MDSKHLQLSIMMHIPFLGPVMRLLYKRRTPKLEREVCGITFPNPLGLGGGVDINGEYYNRIANAGFGFVEIGSITPAPQSNHMPNRGLKYTVEKLRHNRPKAIIGANICKNETTIKDVAAKDYEKCFSLLYDFVDMFIINISSPHISSVYELQELEEMSEIMDSLVNLRMYFNDYRPIFIKISPDITHQQVDDILDYAMRSGIDGIVACNLSRDENADLYVKNIAMVRYIHEKTKGLLPIIASGGVRTPSQAKAMLDAGASLVEICTAFVTKGPGLVRRTIKYLEKNL